MNLHYASTPTTIDPEQPGETGTRLHGLRLIIARVLWITVAILSLGLFVASIPFHSTHIHVVCGNVLCGGSETTAEVARQLHYIGLTVGSYSIYTLILQIIFALGYFTIATIIFWRKSDDRMALLVSLFLVTFVLAYTDVPHVLAKGLSPWWLLVACVGFIGAMTFPLCFYLFPDGQFVPRWIRWLLVGWIAWGILTYFFPDSPILSSTWFLLLESLAFVVGLSSMVGAQVYRYRYVSSPAQRQQTKWAVFGMIVGLGGFFGTGFLGFILPLVLLVLFPQFSLLSPPLLGIAAITASYLTMLLIPLALMMAILRSRLWEIDIIVNRTLVYTTLTGMLTLISLCIVIALQYLLEGLTGQGSELAIVGSTVAIVALFHPLRQRVQIIIDRRFYRRKYDATRLLEAFSTTLRDEVDLNTLTENLLNVVQETMQPTHVSLWLRKPEQQYRDRRTRALPHIEGGT